MLEKDKGPASPHAFLIAIDLQAHVDLEKVKFHLSDAVAWMEGCGPVDVESLGPIETYTAQEDNEPV